MDCWQETKMAIVVTIEEQLAESARKLTGLANATGAPLRDDGDYKTVRGFDERCS